MGQLSTTLLAFNRGLVSRLGLARVDVKRIASLSAEVMTNFIPRVLGSMSIRPGWKYLGGTNGFLATKLIPFIFSVNDTALLELTASTLRVWVNDVLVTRPTVGTSVLNGTFTTDLTSWTDTDEAGATSSWLTGGYLQLLGDATNAAIRDQEVTVAGGDLGTVHALRIVITKGPVYCRVGSSVGAEDYVSEAALGEGTHSLSFTPSGNFWIRFFSRLSRPVLVDSVAIESAGVMTVPTPWVAAKLGLVRWDQSGDIVFVTAAGVQPYKIERRSTESWSVVKFEPIDGPFRIENTSLITLAPSAITGSITITASKSLFRTGQVGALYSITSEGQTVTSNISVVDNFTNAIRITGVDASRVFTIILSGTWTTTVTLQRSLDSDTGPWEDVTTVSWTANTTETYDDGLDNQIAYYRIGVLSTSPAVTGTITATLDYALGSITGLVKITAYTSSVSVSADVLKDLGGLDATVIWAEGEWSDYRGWPTAVALHEGRLWFAGKSSIWGSVTDALDSFSPDVEGDSGAISRKLGVGPVDNINWLASSQRLLIGGDLNEYAARSSSLDEPLTPTAFNVKVTSSQGSGSVMPARIDSTSVFVNRTGIKVFENKLDSSQGLFDYALMDLCQLVPEIGSPGISRMTVQRQPDTRIHCIRTDGTVALAVIDRSEDVLGWCEIETDGSVEDAAVLPAPSGIIDDHVYYIVKRTIDGATVRYLEKWEQGANTVGGVGAPSAGVELFEYSDSTFVQTGQHSDNRRQFYYLSDQNAIYYPDAVDHLIYIHKLDDWTATPATISTGEDISENNHSMNRGNTHLWIGGEVGAGTNIRVVEIATEAVTTITSSGTYEINAAWVVGTAHYIVVTNGQLIQVYNPNLSTGLLGTVVRQWSVSPESSAVSARGSLGTWAADNTLWNSGDQLGRRIYHVDPAQSGTLYHHDFPPELFNGWIDLRADSNLAYDSLRNRMFILVFGAVGASSKTWRLLSYTNWSNSHNSGQWALVDNFDLDSGSATAVYLDPVSDVLVVEGANRIYRYVGASLRLIDISDFPTLGVTEYEHDGNHSVYYIGSCVYTRVSGASGGPIQFSRFFARICFTGPQLFVNSRGESLIPGGSTGRLNGLADSFITYEDPAPISTVTGLDHLEGEEVVVWGNGIDLGTTATYGQTHTVSGGLITLTTATTNIVVGLPYTAQFKSSKLGLITKTEMLFGKEKRITQIALVLADTHAKGLRFGPDFTNLDDRPMRDNWKDVDPDNIDTDYDSELIQFPSTWNPDTRICLQAQAPRPCTVLAVKIDMEV